MKLEEITWELHRASDNSRIISIIAKSLKRAERSRQRLEVKSLLAHYVADYCSVHLTILVLVNFHSNCEFLSLLYGRLIEEEETLEWLGCRAYLRSCLKEVKIELTLEDRLMNLDEFLGRAQLKTYVKEYLRVCYLYLEDFPELGNLIDQLESLQGIKGNKSAWMKFRRIFLKWKRNDVKSGINVTRRKRSRDVDSSSRKRVKLN